MAEIRTALISVSDKTGIIDLARGLADLGIKIMSTGGTAKSIRENDIEVTIENAVNSDQVTTEGDSRYETRREKIGGRNATIVRSRSEIGVTGAYFPAVNKDRRLSISGFNLTEEEKDLTITIVRTIRFK